MHPCLEKLFDLIFCYQTRTLLLDSSEPFNDSSNSKIENQHVDKDHKAEKVEIGKRIAAALDTIFLLRSIILVRYAVFYLN